MKKNAYEDTTIKATQLIENGVEYITEMDGTKLFRKRKYRYKPQPN